MNCLPHCPSVYCYGGCPASAYFAAGLHLRFALYVCTVYCVVCCVLQYIGRCIALYVCADV